MSRPFGPRQTIGDGGRNDDPPGLFNAVDSCYYNCMTKAVFTTKISPTYDDLPEVRYHFPRTYLRTVEEAVGDWIVYYEPRRSNGDPSSRDGRSSREWWHGRSVTLHSRGV